MPFIPQQAPPSMDVDGLRKHGEEQFREVARAWTDVERRIGNFVVLTDYGAVGDGNVANANANATALTSALATGKTVFIPYTAAGYHFGTNQITVGPGQSVVGENQVKLFSTATTSLFYMSGWDLTSSLSNLYIDMSGSGASSTAVRLKTSVAVVYRVRLNRLRFANCVEAIGDEGTNSVVDLLVEDCFAWLTRGLQYRIRRSAGFIVFRDVICDFTQDAATPSWGGFQFDLFSGLELERVDCVGKGPGTPAFNGGLYAITLGGGTPSAALWMNRVFADTFHGHGINVNNVSYVFGHAVESSQCLGNAIVMGFAFNGVFANTLVVGGVGIPNAAAGGAGVSLASCANLSFSSSFLTKCVGSGILIAASNTAKFVGFDSINNGFGFALQTTSTGNVLSNGTLSGNTTAVSNTASGTNVIRDVGGYNPVGVSAAATMGASPFTVTAGSSPETHYVRQSATNTATIVKGGQGVATVTSAVAPVVIELGPNESYVTTWVTTAPTYVRDVH